MIVVIDVHIWLYATSFNWVTTERGPKLWEIHWTNIRQSRAQRSRAEVFKRNYGRACQGLAYALHKTPWLHPTSGICVTGVSALGKVLHSEVIPNVNQWFGDWRYKVISSGCYKSCLCGSDRGWISPHFWSQHDDRRVKDSPQSWSQPAETDRPHTDQRLCVPELSGTVGSFKK